MPSAEAHVATDRPSRYLIQLCKHFARGAVTSDTVPPLTSAMMRRR
ncbi:DUF2218 domain-containing protein [Streptomyces sp. G35A]